MNHGKMMNTVRIGMILMVLCLGLLQGCVTVKPPQFMVFANEPMSKADQLAYPELEEIYASDEKIFVMGWMEVPKAESYPVRVLLQNGNGEKIYEEQKDIKVRVYKEKPVLYYENNIPLNPDLKAKLFSTNVLTIYCDNKVVAVKQIKYDPQDIINRNIKQVVILPFYSKSQETLDYQSKEQILNTFADAIGCEIKRIAAEVIPHFIAEQKLGDLKVSTCLQKPECRARLKEIFGQGIFITGNVRVPKYTHEAFELEVFIFDSKTGEERKFKYDITDESEVYIEPKMKKIIKGVLGKGGLWDYLRGL